MSHVNFPVALDEKATAPHGGISECDSQITESHGGRWHRRLSLCNSSAVFDRQLDSGAHSSCSLEQFRAVEFVTVTRPGTSK